MIVQAILFYIFATVAVASGVLIPNTNSDENRVIVRNKERSGSSAKA